MINNIDVLHLLATKEQYDRFTPFIKQHLIGSEAWQIIQDLEEYYKDFDVVDWSKFAEWFLLVKHPIYKPEKAEIYKKIFSSLSEYTAEDDYESMLIEHFISKDYATKIAEAALCISEGSDEYDLGDIQNLLEDYAKESKVSGEEDPFTLKWDWNKLFATSEGEKKGLTWRLDELNEALGPINKGDFLVFASYSGSGKTTMLASEASHMSKQLNDGEHIIWFNNEEAGEGVQKRLCLAAAGMSTKEQEANPLKALERVKESKIFDRIIFRDQSFFTTKDIENVLRKYNPRLIIIDQLYKVHGYGRRTESEVTRMGMIFQWGREIAKEYCPVLAAHQADGSAIGQLFIEMNQLHMSKVAVQGEMDAIITLGRRLDKGYENVRGLYTPKNKLTGKETFKAEIIIDPERVLYYSPRAM